MHDRPIDLVTSHLEGVRSQGKGYRAHCPAHDDKHPSLDVTEGTDGTVLVNCRSRGCSFDSIASALGLEKGDFFPSRNGSRFTKDDADAALTNRGLSPKTIRHFRIIPDLNKPGEQ